MQEDQYEYQCMDYLSKVSKIDSDKNVIVNEECRTSMATWCYQMVSFCNFKHNTAATALAYLDSYLSNGHDKMMLRDRRQFQLACMCSLMIAAKLHESTKLDVELLSELSKGCFSKNEIITMEMKILFGLGWRLCPPTAFEFLEILTSNRLLCELARLQIEAASKDYYFVTVKPSCIALAALLNALTAYSTDDDASIIELVMTIAGKNNDSINTLQSKLQQIITNVPEANEQNDSKNNKDSHAEANRQHRRAFKTYAPKSPTSVRNWTHRNNI